MGVDWFADSIGRSKNFYETLSEFLNFCILAVSWDIFRQCDLKKKNWWNCMFRKTQKQLKKRLWLHCGILKVLETKEKSGVDIILLSTHVFFPQFFFMIQQKEDKIGFFTVVSSTRYSLGFHLHTHITIIISSALYLLKSAIKTEWLQKIPRFF